jgi:chloramphenicol 3-O-phosphotransferase
MPIYKNEAGETMTQELLQQAAEMSGMSIDQYANSLGYKLVDEEEETVIDPGKELGAATQGAGVGPLRPEYLKEQPIPEGWGWNLENILSDSPNQVSAELDTPDEPEDPKGGWLTMDSKLETARAALGAIKISPEQIGEIEAQADKPIEVVERELEYNAKLDKYFPTGEIISTTYEDRYKDYIQQAKVDLAKASDNEYDIYTVPEEQWRKRARSMYIDEKKEVEMRRQAEEVLEEYEKDVFGSWFSFARLKKFAKMGSGLPSRYSTDEEIEYKTGRAILTSELEKQVEEATTEFNSTIDKITTYANIMQTSSVELDRLQFKFNNDPGSITNIDKIRYNELANTQATAGQIYNTLFNKLGDMEGASDKASILADMTKRTYNNLDVANNRITGAVVRTMAGLGSVAHELSPQQLIKRTTGYDVNEEGGYLPMFLAGVAPTGIAGSDDFKEGVDALYEEVEEIENATKQRQQLGEIQGIEDFGEFMLDLFSEQAVNTAITVSTGGAGLLAVSAAAGGNKFHDMDLEMEHDPDLKISAFQFYGAGVLYGAAEYVTEKVSFGQAKRGLNYLTFGKNNFKKATKGAKSFDVGEAFTLDTFSKRKALLDYGINVNKEGGAELAAQLINNGVDKYLLDKDIAITDGLGEAYLTGAIMSGLGFQAPVLAGDIYRAFNGSSEITKLNNRSQRLEAIRTQRETIIKNMPKNGDANAENTLNILAEEADKLIIENLKSKKLNENRIDELSNNDKRALLDIDANTYKLKREIDKLNENPNLAMDQKKKLIADLQSKIMMANSVKDIIIADATNSKAVEKQNKQQIQYAAENNLSFKAINVTTQEQAYEQAAIELDNKIAEIKNSGELTEAKTEQIKNIKRVKDAVKLATDNGRSAGMYFGAEVGVPITISVGETLAADGLGATILHETAHATLFKKLFEGDADIIGLVNSFESYMVSNFKGAKEKFAEVEVKYPLGEGPNEFTAAEIAEEKLATMLEYTYNVDMNADRTFSKKVVDQFRKIVPQSEVTTVKNGQDVFRALQSFSRGFDKGEITGLADKVLKGNVKAAQTEAKKQAKTSKVTFSLTSAKENLDKIDVKDLKGVRAQTDIAMELPGMVLAQVLGRFNLSPQTAADMRDAVVEKIYLAQETTKWDGRGQLYGFINGRIALRIKDIVKEEYNRPAEERLFLASVEGLQAEDQKHLATPDPTPTKTAEKPKYRKIKDSNVLSNEVVNKIKTKVVSATRVLKSKLDAKVSLNKTVTPLIAEIKKTMGKQADIDLKTVMGGKQDGKLQKFLLKNKKAILENMTTTWLMQAMPGAVQKQVDGKFITEWQGKKIDRESVETDNAGRTSGSDLVRRLPNAYKNLSDTDFLSYILDDVKIDTEGNITSGNPIRGKKESLAKAMAEEISLELFEDAINDPDSDITKAFEKNQGALGVVLVDNYISDVTRQVERGNVKFSLAGMNPVQNDLFQQKEYKDKLNKWIQGRDGNIGKNYKGLLSGLKEAYAGVEDLDSKLVPIAKTLFNVMKPYLKDQGKANVPKSGATVSAILEASYDSIDFAETIGQITGATMSVAKALDDPAMIEEAKEAVLKSFKGLDPSIVLSFISSTFANSGKVGRFKDGVKTKGASRADLWENTDAAVAALKEAYPDTDWDNVSRDFSATAKVNKAHLGKLDTAKEILKADAAWDMTIALIKQLNNVEDPNVKAIIMASMNSGTNTVLRVAAPAVWRSSVLPSQNPKDYRYEHAVPSRVVMSLLYDHYVNKNADIDVNALKSDYVVAIIPVTMDAVIGEVGFSKMMLAGYIPGKSPWYQRYYNLLTRGKVQYAIESQIDGKLIGESFAEYYKDPNKITIKESRIAELAKIETQQKAINLANTIKFSQTPKKIRVFDFDDTLAQTKSNVLYTMPNVEGGFSEGATKLKAIFLVGGPGAGKTNVGKGLQLGRRGYKVVNQDIALEAMKIEAGLPANESDYTAEQRSMRSKLGFAARKAAVAKFDKYAANGDGMVIDGTGASYNATTEKIKALQDQGFEVHMVVAMTPLETALERNRARKERSLQDFIVEKTYDQVQASLAQYRKDFGDKLYEINTETIEYGKPLPKDFLDQVYAGITKTKVGKIDAATFAKDAVKMEADGAQWDFSEFSKVMNGTKGPLFEVAKIIADKRGTKDVFVLTARPADAAGPIQEFLNELGLNIPLENITGLGNGTPKAKADWIIGKVSEGYNDFYFADDHTGNVKAVKDALNTFDVKGKVQQAKIKFSNTLDKNFNDIIERTTGIESVKKFSDIVAKRRGAKAGRFKIWMPSSLDDFKGLTSYTFAGKGRQGEADQKFFQDALINPYFKAIRAIEVARQTVKDDFKGLNKMFKPVVKKLGKLTPDGDYTYDQAVRVYLWNKAGYDVPGLPKRDNKKLNDLVAKDPELSSYADGLMLVSKTDKWSEPGEHWNAQTILSDLNNLTEKKGRKEYLAEFIENAGIIFSSQNLNKIEAIYGTKHRDALEDILYRMENGTNRPSGSNKTVNKWNNWVNNSIGSIMFFNRRSAVLQTLSIANFLNWSDNNPVKAGLAFANQPQYWKDFAMIFNSPMLKQRRAGLKSDVNEAEIANAVKGSKNKATAALSYLLKKGFLPTQMVDSFAIASGGATFYRNRVNSLMKKGLSKAEAEAQAFEDFSQISEETQQSGDPALISSDQASSLGRLVLAFQNTPIQLNRSIKKAFLDLYNRRRSPGQTQLQSDMGNVSKMVYYGAIQNLIFSSLQSALFALIPGFDDDDDELTEEEQKLKYGKVVSTKQSRIINSMIDTTLKGGFGLPGAVVSTLKNVYQEYEKQDAKGFTADHTYTVLTAANISPPIGSKLRKMYGGIQTKQFDKDVIKERGWDVTIDGKFNLSPSYSVLGSEVEAFTNIPLERMVSEIDAITEAMDSRNSAGQRIALSLGWKTYDVGAVNEEHELIKTGAKAVRKEEGKIKSKETRAKNTLEKRLKQEAIDKAYWEEYYRKLDSTLVNSKKLK